MLAHGTAIVVAGATAGCAAGMPLLHPADVLESGQVRLVSGISANAATGALSKDLRDARAFAASGADIPGAPGSNSGYAKGALVAAAIGPGIAPYIGARVGLGSQFEGGLAYTGRAARLDARRAFKIGEGSYLSVGAGGTAALYGRDQSTTLPDVDLGSLHGYGFDVPVLVGHETAAGLYRVWAGARFGYEHDAISELTSEPTTVTLGTPPTDLAATRFYGGAVAGIAVGFRFVHVALELDAAYEHVDGRYNSTDVTIGGVSLTPATALWFAF